MLTGAPPADRAPLTPSPRRRVWPWAAGSIFVTLAIIAATLVGHRLAAQHRLASEVAPAPALPPLAVQAIARAPGQITQMTLDKGAHTLVAQVVVVSCQPPLTPYPTRCAPVGTPQVGAAFYDSQSGALHDMYLAPSSDSGETYALTDTTHSLTYLLEPSGVTIFSDTTGKQVGKYASHLDSNLQSVAMDEQTGVIYTFDLAGDLSAYDAATGQRLAAASYSYGPNEQLLVDTGAHRIYTYFSGGDNPGTLGAYDAGDLSRLGEWQLAPIPGGAFTLGPLDSATHSLYFSGDGDSAWRLDLTTLASGADGQAVTPVRDTALDGMIRFGFDHATGAALLDSNAGVALMATGATRPSAGLMLVRPLATYYDDASPWLLPVDSAAGLAYVAGDDNTILIVSLAQPTSHAAPTALTAEVIARAGMASLLPDTNQSPHFLSAQTFPLGTGSVARQYFIHYSDQGWQGPYAGSASLGAVKAGGTAGDYTMTFSVAWNQLFLRQHSWTVEVTPDGRTHLLADSGDAIP